MILVIGPYPSESNQMHGMVQRITAIDPVLKSDSRVYLDICLFQALYRKRVVPEDNVHEYRLNLFIFFPFIVYLSIVSRFIYVHTIVNSTKIIPIYFFKKLIITDLHGVIPEECAFSGRPFFSRVFAIIEWLVFRTGKVFITVTRSMERHFKGKYSYKNKTYLNVPIFDHEEIDLSRADPVADKLKVIYSGRLQKWQNIDLMLDAVHKVPNLVEYTFLVSHPDELKAKAVQKGVDLKGVQVTSAPKKELSAYYACSDLGFVLRDDHVVNRVACPTKLIEYINYGVVPIVLEPSIGDFKELGYYYISFRDFCDGNLPARESLAEMKKKNSKILDQLLAEKDQNLQALIDIINQY